MVIKLLFSFILILSAQKISGALPCNSSLQKFFVDTPERKIKRLEEAALRLEDIPFDNDISTDRLKLLKANSDLGKILKQISTRDQKSTHFSFWLPFEEALMTEDIVANPEQVQRILQAFNALMSDPILKSKNIRELILINSIQAKKSTIAVLDRLSKFYSIALGHEVDLTDTKQLLKFYGVQKKADLGQRIRELKDQNIARANELKPVLNAEFTGNERYERLYQKLLFQIFPDRRQIPLKRSASNFILSRLDESITTEIVEGLVLDEELKAKYLKAIATVEESRKVQTDSNRNIASTLVLIIINAYKDAKGLNDPLVRGIIDSQVVVDAQIIGIRNAVQLDARIRDIIDIKFSEYIDQVDQLNARRLALFEKVSTIRNEHPEIASKLNEIENAIPKKEIDDIDEDLIEAERKLSKIESELDRLFEDTLAEVEPEDINSLVGLNYRWERLRANKAYRADGIDYDNIVFSPAVVNFFKNDPRLGSRFLAALKKSYVAIKKSSGLRRLPGIHKDFRDIKMIRGHGKIRIVGKLIERRIHFFYIHDSEEAYKDAQMKSLIERFSP